MAPAERQIERSDRAQSPGRSGRGGTRWPWLIVTIGVFATKADALAHLVEHRQEVITLLAVGLAASLLRFRPLRVATLTAPLVALALAPASTLLGIALGVGTFVTLIALFFTISTVLHARQDATGR